MYWGVAKRGTARHVKSICSTASHRSTLSYDWILVVLAVLWINMKEAVALLQYCNVYKYKYNPYEHEMLATYAIATTLLVGLIWFSWYSCGRERENSANILSGWDYGEHCIRMQNGQCLAINTALIDGSKRQTANGWTNCDQTRSFCAHVLFRQQFFFCCECHCHCFVALFVEIFNEQEKY